MSTTEPTTKLVNLSRISPENMPEAMERLKQYYPGPYAITQDPMVKLALEMFDGDLILELPVQKRRASVKSEAGGKGMTS